MELHPQKQNAVRRVGIIVTCFALIIYILAIIWYFIRPLEQLPKYFLIGSHVMLLSGLLLIFEINRFVKSTSSGLLLFLSFLFLLIVPICFYLLNRPVAHFDPDVEITLFYKKGNLDALLPDIPNKGQAKAAEGIVRKIKSYQMLATIGSNAHIIINFEEGGTETVTLNNLADLASIETVLNQPNVVMYTEGVTKTLKPDNLILKSF